MTPEKFRAWYATLPPAAKAHARRLYDAGLKSGKAHTATSMALIMALTDETITHEGTTHDFISE